MRPNPGLYEFLQESELIHYYTAFKNILQVHNVGQLKYVTDDDLSNIGMSRPECRRLKTFFNKYCPVNYATKLRRLLGRKEEGKEECLLGEEMNTSKGAIKVPSQHVIHADSIVVYKELGEGEFGIVQQGVWTDDDGMRHQVAVKCLSKKRMQNNTVEFMKEYDIMQTIDHNNIVRLYGVVLDSAQIMLITELAPLRSLLECLKETSLRTTFTTGCLAEFCQQICCGMTYLENKRLIHRDLAARNILVYSKNLVKISDFGLSRALGVGKDYYQTNFNVNLKLPIAWCAPECINFLKFTSASDVWAFGVTMWEMFSYGFQPWPALTGHQILEAIDEPGGGQRLEQPVHCPREHYAIMEATWTHRPDLRPTFAKLSGMLEEARPEQVQVIVPGGGPGLLQYNVGEILTVLDKHTKHAYNGAGNLWNGVNNLGKVGLFLPEHTVTYLGNLPGTGVVPQWNSAPAEPPASSGFFQRSTLRGSKDRGGSGRKKISRDMISGPTGNVQHTGHVGPDGCVFGDVNFISGTNGNLTIGGRLPSTGSDNGFPSWSKADSDASESVPLISAVAAAKSVPEKQNQPRMGHAIGYLRKQPEKEDHAHQYQSISDEENEHFGSPLDLGPSLLDEVFSELENYDTLKIGKDVKPGEEEEHHGLHGIVESCHKFKDKVQTLTLSRRHKGKKAAFVKPIKASDERTLENAIIMANQIASKSMHDLDKRCTDDMFNASPQVSPLTPNSPSKKFTFKFPTHSKQKSSSPSRHFTDEVQSRTDLNAIITPSARDAYRALIDGDKHVVELPKSSPSPSTSFHRLSLPPTASVFKIPDMDQIHAPLIEEGANPLPLPPKDRKSSVTSGKRHIRKNPLIIPSGAAASMVRRLEDNVELEPVPPPNRTKLRTQPDKVPGRELETYNDAFEEEIAYSIDALDDIQESLYNSPKTSLETALPVNYGANSLPGTYGAGRYGSHEGGSGAGPLSLPSAEDQEQDWKAGPPSTSQDQEQGWKARSRRGLDSDEVRIMSKVLGGVSCDKAGCLAALNITDWNVHKAIKIVKLKGLVQKPGVTDSELKISLMNSDWDVAGAVSILRSSTFL